VGAVAGAHDVRRSSVRVALATTAVVAVVYVAIAVAVMLIVTGNLTHQVDDRLTGYLAHPVPGVGDGDEHHGLPGEPGDRPFGPQLLIWLVRPDGAIVSDLNASPPASALAATSPTTTTINGTSIRVAGTQTSFGHLLVGQDLTDVNRTQSTLFLAEVIIGPILLLAVFLGAVAIGRRVATPIEIARRRQLEDELRAANTSIEEQLEETRKSLLLAERRATLGTLAGGVGHELRNPLGVMTNSVYYLKAVMPSAPPKVSEYLDILQQQITLSEKIVSDLLDFARQKPPQRAEVSVAEITNAQLARLGPTNGVAIRTEFGATLPPIYVDQVQCGQIILNLLTNALQALDGKGHIDVRAERENGHVNLIVRDNGPGIAPENLHKIFEPLFTTKARGIGLGLAVSRTLARANGGDLTARSDPGSGAEFTLTVPVAAAVEAVV